MDNVPIILTPYRIDKTLGLGAFGKVKLAHHIMTGIKVAVKILNRKKIKNQDMAEKVKREINILDMCSHPHIIRQYEVIDTPSDIFMIMEFVPNGELFDYIESRGRLTSEEARRFFQQLIAGIEYCHYNRIVHRDLKPENLLLDSDNNIKIADFGLSNVAHDGDFLRTSCGSPNYAAPEVISGNLYAGPEVDVWSCGVILYALLCGTLPFDDKEIPVLFKKIKSGIFVTPTHVSQPARDLINRMLVVDPMRRTSIADVRTHAWYKFNLPEYLQLPPATIDLQEKLIDPEIAEKVAEIASFNTKQMVSPAMVNYAVTTAKEKKGPKLVTHNGLKVIYQLLLDDKRHKQRLEDVVLARRDLLASSTPQGSSPRTPSLSMSHTTSSVLKSDHSTKDFSLFPGLATRAPFTSLTNIDLSNRRRRWYLGIQSKKEPFQVMNEVYQALRALRCVWKQQTNYRVLALWRYHSDIVVPDASLPASNALSQLQEAYSEEMKQSQEYHNFIDDRHRFSSINILNELDLPSDVHFRSSIDKATPMVVEDEINVDVFDNMNDENDEEFPMHDVPDLEEEDDEEDVENQGSPQHKRSRHTSSEPRSHNHISQSHVKIALTLYKVQPSIYLLDFQRLEDDTIGFLKLCAHIITELKNISAAARVAAMMSMQNGGNSQRLSSSPVPMSQA